MSAEHDGERGRSAALDGVRGLAALSVLVYHVWLYTQAHPDATNRTGWLDYPLHELRLGLVAFFVLSGFLLYRPWLRAALGETATPRLGSYLLRRAARVVPAYYLALAGSVALLWNLDAVPGVRIPAATDIPLFAVFAENFFDGPLMSLDPPMWTLSVEVSFYLALPLAGWAALRAAGGRLRQAAVPLALLAIGVGWNLLIAGRGWPMPVSQGAAGDAAVLRGRHARGAHHAREDHSPSRWLGARRGCDGPHRSRCVVALGGHDGHGPRRRA